jgi:acyl dehydratase
MALNYERVMAYRPADIAVQYGARDCIIYALGIGLGMDPIDPGQLKFVYEKNLVAFPTMAAVLGRLVGLQNDPAFGIDQRMMVAAALKVVLHRPLATEAKLVSRPHVREVIDKGPGSAAILEITRELRTPDGELVATIDNSILVRKHGGFGGKVTQVAELHAVPSTKPDTVCDLLTPPNLALLYRLTGDMNPLHADPERAKSVGFERPILHGAATFGVAAHAVLRHITYQADKLASIEARFVRPVFPGDTLRTEIWRDANRISFQSRAVGRDDLVLTNGLAIVRS